MYRYLSLQVVLNTLYLYSRKIQFLTLSLPSLSLNTHKHTRTHTLQYNEYSSTIRASAISQQKSIRAGMHGFSDHLTTYAETTNATWRKSNQHPEMA